MLTQRGRLLDDIEDIRKKMGGMRIPRMLLKKLVDDVQKQPLQDVTAGGIPGDMLNHAWVLLYALETVEAAVECIKRTDQRLPGKRTTDG